MSHSDHGGHTATKLAPPPIPLAPLPASSKSSHSPHPPQPHHAAHAAPAPHRAVAAVAQPRGHFHPLPVIGHAEAFYLKHIQQAEAVGDHHARAAHKVGQHVTSALDPQLSWEQKHKRFVHCLHKYCIVPHDADDTVRTFYQKLGDLIRRHAGQEALHLARAKHQAYQQRLRNGEARDKIEDDAETFFPALLGHAGRPEWCGTDAWAQLTALRDHWV